MKGEKRSWKVFSHFAEPIGGQSSNVGVILQSVLWQLSKSSRYHQLKEDINDRGTFYMYKSQIHILLHEKIKQIGILLDSPTPGLWRKYNFFKLLPF